MKFRLSSTSIVPALEIASAMVLSSVSADAGFMVDRGIEQQIVFNYDMDPAVVGYDDTSGDSIMGATAADINRDIVAGFLGQGYQASGSVGRFGNLGLEGRLTTRNELHAQVIIFSDVHRNLTGRAQTATANFIIDGGFFFLDTAPGGELRYTVTIQEDGDTKWQTFGQLMNDGQTSTFTNRGDNVGAVFNGTSRVDIPFSFQSADLGIIQPGESVDIEYQLDIVAIVPQFAEGLFFEFSDPLDVDGFGDFPMDIVFSPIPEPSNLILAMMGIVTIWSIKRRVG
jgi:hypothetical protein